MLLLSLDALGVEVGAALEDWFQLDELVDALTLVLAAVDDVDESATTGVAAEVVVVLSVADVLEDLVLLLQPLRANPARIKVNNIVFFIGGLITARLTPRAWFGSPVQNPWFARRVGCYHR